MANDRDVRGSMSRRNVNRTRRAVQAVESSPSATSMSSTMGVRPYTYGVVYAKVATAIPSGTWAVPSTAGRVQLSHWDGSAWKNSGDPVEVVSRLTFPAPIPVGRVVTVGWSGGKWILVSGSCS